MIGDRIAMLRRRTGLSQKALAQRLQVSPSAVGMYEQGRREPSADKLVEMAAIFQVSTDYLLSGEAAEPRDRAAMDALLDQAAERFGGQLLLQKPDGSVHTLSREELGALFGALLGD